ncbi:unnamed protein product [Linum tenue]|uniref:Cytochrome P450 n=1 Tax=Linum tenue TaxID=586396 RepID=A0AAV0MN10_9ROSI|nr:unnamed protein product [Linum tenue]
MEAPHPGEPPPTRHPPSPRPPLPLPHPRPALPPPPRLRPDPRRLLAGIRQTDHENPRPRLLQPPLLRHLQPPPLQLQGPLPDPLLPLLAPDARHLRHAPPQRQARRLLPPHPRAGGGVPGRRNRGGSVDAAGPGRADFEDDERRRVQGGVRAEVRRRRRGGGRWWEKSEEEEDIVDVLLQIQRETSNSAVDRDTIKAIVLDMFAAGSDTTYTALEWTMTEILRHPRVMEKLQQEIRVILGDERNVNEEVIERMDYLKAVIKESFRLHPPIPLLVPRESTQDVKVQGYDVPEKTRVIVNAWAIGRDPKRWGDDAEEFRPERFLNSKVDFKGQDFELIPFGAGRRGCPGISFATASMEITLVSMLHRFDWSVPGGEEGGGLDADEAPGLAVHRRTPLLAVPTLYSP